VIKTGRLGKALIVVLVCLVLVLGIIGLKLVAVWHDPTAAYFCAEGAVKARVRERLLAPASAVFPTVLPPLFWDSAVSATPMGGGAYRVTAWLDASNAFGAKLRSRWTCDVRKSSGFWVPAGPCGPIDNPGLWREGAVRIAP
jgi:hypothetical protein